MSKQSEAKKKQDYVPKAIPQTCGNCGNLEQTPYYYSVETNDRIEGLNPDESKYALTYYDNLRCGIGGFAVRKMGTCNGFVGKTN
jgi:hypothetical protein